MTTSSSETALRRNPRSAVRLVFSVLAVVLFLSTGLIARDFHEAARAMPLYVSNAALALALISLTLDLIRWRKTGSALEEGGGSDLSSTGGEGQAMGQYLAPRLRYIGWILAFVGLMALVGTLISVPVFVVVFLKVEARASWVLAIGGAVATVLLLLLLQWLGGLYFPQSLIGL